MQEWNLNLIGHHCHKATSEFLDALYSRLFFQLITRPTRITAHKASLIDNIFTNDPFRPSICGLFLNDISIRSFTDFFHSFWILMIALVSRINV